LTLLVLDYHRLYELYEEDEIGGYEVKRLAWLAPSHRIINCKLFEWYGFQATQNAN